MVTARLPGRTAAEPGHFWADVTKGVRIYTRTPRLRGLMVMEAAVAAAGRDGLREHRRSGAGRPRPWRRGRRAGLCSFGAGSMLAAFLLPRLLDRMQDRPVMIGGAALMVAGVALVSLVRQPDGPDRALGRDRLWLFADTDSYRTHHQPLRARGGPGAVFAAQFALSHACWLVTYPLAGWIGATAGLSAAALTLAVLGAAGLIAVLWLWPADDISVLPHDHPDLPPDHPHLAAHGPRHAHAVVIDDLHRRCPRRHNHIKRQDSA